VSLLAPISDFSLATLLTGPAVYLLAIAVVVVGLGHVTHRMHIFHESQVPSQQT
jgi:hypothetical protein